MTSASPHFQRVVTGTALAALLTVGLAMGGWVLLIMVVAVASLALLEFYTMFWPGNARLPLKAAGMALGAAVLAAGHMDRPWMVLGCVAAAFLVGAVGFLLTWGNGEDDCRFTEGQVLAAGILYVPVLLLPALHFNRWEQLVVVLAAVISDTGAYFIGTWFGKARIWPRVSPKKSWAGSLGGLTLCVLATTGVGVAAGTAPWWAFALLGGLLNVASQLGDFFESALKRTLGVKDSGALLPGHGGLLDRIDSLLFVVPAYAALDSVFPFF